MELNEHQIQDLKLSDLKSVIGKTIKITLKKPIKIQGIEEEQIELIGVLNQIGLASNPPNLPVDLNVAISGTEITKNVIIFRMEKLEWE